MQAVYCTESLAASVLYGSMVGVPGSTSSVIRSSRMITMTTPPVRHSSGHHRRADHIWSHRPALTGNRRRCQLPVSCPWCSEGRCIWFRKWYYSRRYIHNLRLIDRQVRTVRNVAKRSCHRWMQSHWPFRIFALPEMPSLPTAR